MLSHSELLQDQYYQELFQMCFELVTAVSVLVNLLFLNNLVLLVCSVVPTAVIALSFVCWTRLINRHNASRTASLVGQTADLELGERRRTARL